MKTSFSWLSVLMNLLVISVSSGEVSVAGQNSSTALAYTTEPSATDLINAGQSTLSSATVSTTQNVTAFPGSGINNGGYSNNLTGDNTFFMVSAGNFPATATYILNTSVNTLGYDIASIKSFMGWATVSAAQANQTYTVEVRSVGSAIYSHLATVSYKPFADTNSPAAYETFVTVTDTGGVLATGVDSIRFTFANPIGVDGVAPGAGTTEGTLIREIDVFGVPTSGVPIQPTKLAVTSVNGGANPTVGVGFSVAVQAQDAGGIPRKVTSATAVSLGLQMGNGSLAGTLTGTISAGSQSVVISGVTYDQAESGVILTASRTNGDNLTAAESAPFTVDAVAASLVTITSPTSRHIVQRNAANTGNLSISGNYTGAPERVEARAVVMPESGNSGSTTAWQTIQTNPSGGSFTGALTSVSAGGWYQLEVRAVTAGTPGTATTMAKVGVGDLYITAGQSNSANHGAPGYTPSNDRVSTRTALSASSWRHGYDPQPLASGGGGSVWSRLGDQLTVVDNVPIGFLCVGVGSTQVSQWVPGTSNYNNLLKPALQSLPAGGFRAVLWHQGESDALASVTAATHAGRLNSMIAQSRTDAGWAVPWYLAEASFHPGSNLAQEEPVCAGQRAAIHGDANVYLGPSTDPFHLESAAGGKLSDTVHFNASGLLDHATQWRDILRGTTTTTPRNGNFEENRAAAITGLGPLADNATHIVTTTANDSPSVIGWRILSANGTTAADGSNGFYNPGSLTYANAVDSTNNGVLPNMDGRHVAVLDGGSIGNAFLHSTRAITKADSKYTLSVSIGVRDDAASFGGAQLEILANGLVVASSTFDKAKLDALHGGNCAGSFTNVSLVYVTDHAVTANQPLAIRIAKSDGTGKVLDFDNVRFTVSALTAFQLWQKHHFSSITEPKAQKGEDFDGDGIINGIEYFLGSSPSSATAHPQIAQVTNAGRAWKRYSIPLDPTVSDVGLELQYSHDLLTWHVAATSIDGSVVSNRLPESWSLDIADDFHVRAFYRVFLDPASLATP